MVGIPPDSKSSVCFFNCDNFVAYGPALGFSIVSCETKNNPLYSDASVLFLRYVLVYDNIVFEIGVTNFGFLAFSIWEVNSS